jgi:hypothetical protein
MVRYTISVVLFALSIGAVFGQIDRANVSGTVTDTSGSLVPGARVEVVSQDTGFRREVQTGPSGNYSVPGIPIGTYTLKISKNGFRTFDMKGVQLSVGQSRTVDAKLEVGAIATQVEVQAQAAALETSNSQVGGVLEHKQLSDIPLNGRNWSTLELLTPGAINTGGGSQRDIRFAGHGLDDANYTFDGIDATGVQEQSQKADARLNISLESIAEFRVNSSNYTADSGSAGGGQVNAVSKTGTNTFHGGAFEYFRNDALDARSPFDPSQIPPFRMNQFGGSIGGPIRKNKTFFFAAYEAIRQSLTDTMIGYVPNAAYRAQVMAVSPVLKPFLDGYPAGQTHVDSITDQYTSAGVNSTREDSGTIRVDHRFTDSTTMFVRYNIDDAFKQDPIDNLGGRETEPIRPSNMALQLSHVFSTRVVNEAKFGVNRSAFHHPTSGTSPTEAGFGAIGVSSIPGFDDLTASQLDLEVGTTFSWIDNLSIIRGRHTLKFGVDIERIRLNNSSAAVPYSIIGFADPDSFIHNQIDTVNTYAALAVGGMRRTFWMGYAQDEFKVRPNLTVNIGLRYEFYSVMHEVLDRIAVVDFACGGFCPPGTPMYSPNYKDFMPRVSLAWTPAGANGKTVIRTGWGLYYSANQNDDFSDPHESTAARYALSSADVPNLSYPLAPFLPLLQNQGASPKGIDRHRKDGYFENWNFMVQRQLPSSFIASLGYVGSEGHHLFGGRATNPINPLTGTRPLPQFGKFSIKYNDSNTNFNALQGSLLRSFTKGWLWQTQYMWSHSIGDGSIGTGETASIENANCRACDRSSSLYDVRHTLTINSVYDLPFGPGQSLWNTKGLAGKLIGGWSLSGIATASTGRPINITVTRSSSAMLDGNSSNQRPNLVPGVSIYAVNQTINNWFNPAAFAVPAKNTWGNLGRNIARGPGSWEMDTALEKGTRLSEKVNLKFRAEAFNLLNHPIFANPASNFSASSSFGVITHPLNTGAVGTGLPRRLQLMLRLEF